MSRNFLYLLLSKPVIMNIAFWAIRWKSQKNVFCTHKCSNRLKRSSVNWYGLLNLNMFFSQDLGPWISTRVSRNTETSQKKFLEITLSKKSLIILNLPMIHFSQVFIVKMIIWVYFEFPLMIVLGFHFCYSFPYESNIQSDLFVDINRKKVKMKEIYHCWIQMIFLIACYTCPRCSDDLKLWKGTGRTCRITKSWWSYYWPQIFDIFT